MQVVAGGNYCGTCRHVVVDFSDWNEADIILYLKSRGGEKTCGHFRNDQLMQKKSHSAVWKFARMVALTILGLFISKSEALAQKADVPSEELPSATVSDSVVWVIRGEVKCDTQLVPGARVAAIAANGDTLASSEVIDGRFEMHVPVAYRGQTFSILASAPGYKLYTIPNYVASAGNVLAIPMEKNGTRKKINYPALGCPSF
ncbi:MAG TPA: carboxypeptidase-like regulatory domain-containing protein [Bacteroidia bacterium]|nr:carboxypeptidase-like regulatory domain-containing protein [Bacteroidia bacterium]